jgi:4-amino-4-deoxy-L-arabinose transferase-like glycosyltransferase
MVSDGKLADRPGRLRGGRALSRRSWVVLWVIVLAGAALRLAWMFTQAPVIGSDGAEYARMGENLRLHHALVGNFDGPEILYGPLYPVLIAAAMSVLPDSESAGHALALLFGLALIVLVYLAAERVYGRRCAYLCAALAALHPLLIALSGSVYNEVPYLALWAAMLYCGLRALDREHVREWLWLGLCGALAYLTRVEAFAYLLLVLAVLLAAGWARKKLRAAAIGSMVALIAFFLLASPYVDFLRRHTGALRLEAKWDINYTMARNRLAGMNSTEADYGLGPDLARKGPLLAPFAFANFTPYSRTPADKARALAAMAKYNAKRVYHYLVARELGAPVLTVLVVLGLFGEPWSNRRLLHESLLLAMFAAVVLVVLTSSTAEGRYLFAALPVLVLWAGKGLDRLAQWVAGSELVRRARRRPASWLPAAAQVCALVLLVGLCVGPVGGSWLFEAERGASAFAARDAGRWIAQHDPGPKRIAAQSAVIPYYAKGTLMTIPYADAETTLRYLVREKIDFVVLDSREADNYPTVNEWLAHGVPDPNASLVYDRAGPDGARVAVYRLIHDPPL